MTGATSTLTPPPTPLGQGAGRPKSAAISAAGWALSMAAADRRNIFRLVVMAVGVGLCTFVLLALATISPLVDSMNNRAAASTPQLTSGAGTFETLPVSVSVDGRSVNGMVLRPFAARPPAPPGTSRFPGDGEIVASPALSALLADPAQRTMRAVVPGTVVGVIDPKVLPGPHDYFFYQGSAALTGGVGADVWGTPAGQHPLDPRVWSLLITGVIVVMVPLLLFAALAGRIGAARRDRRSATLRLLGASTGRLRLLLAGEALIAAVAGILMAAGAYLLARRFAPDVQIGGRGIQDSDLTPGVGWAAAIAVGVPLLAVAATFADFRAATVSPLGVLNRSRNAPRASWRLALVIAALASAGWAQWNHQLDNTSGRAVVELCAVVALSLFAVAAMVGLVTERIARRWTGGTVSGLLGRRRIIQDGSTTTRAAAALATTLAGFVVLMTVLSGTHYADLQAETAGSTEFWGSVPALTGAEWSHLQTSLDTVPGVERVDMIAALAGSTTGDRPQLAVATCHTIDLIIGGRECREGDTFHVRLSGQPLLPAGPYHLQIGNGQTQTWTPPATTRQVRQPVAADQDGTLLPTDYLLTPTAAEQQFPGLLPQLPWMHVMVHMPLSAVDGVQQAVSWLGWRGYGVISLSAAASLHDSPVPWIRAGLIACALMTLVICAVGQALMAAEQITERRRAFALARASGVPLSVLGRSIFHAALLPVAVAIVLAATVGATLAPYVQYLRGSVWLPPTWPWILLGSAAALGVTLLVAIGSHLTLRGTTGPGALRTE